MSEKRKYSKLLILASALVLLLAFGSATQAQSTDLIITGVVDGPLLGGTPKAIELYVVNDIADLSIYGLSSANNGGGTTGAPEYTFPADAVTAGTFIYVATEAVEFNNFFGFAPTYTNGSAPSVNGDDAIELFQSGVVVDVFGDVNVDGSSQPWEYLDGWTYRVDGTGPDGSIFILANWTFSGPNALDGETTNATATTPFPIGSYVSGGGGDTAPVVSSTSPGNGAANVALMANIDINFNEAVTVTGSWFDISCDVSGSHTAVVSGNVQNYTLDPDTDFANNDTCVVSVFAAQVTDDDTEDPPDNMAADYSFSFITEGTAINEVVINEFLADPAADLPGDANGDGTRDSAQDEFVEIVNTSGGDLDISGWTLSDGFGLRHTFPVDTVLLESCSVVIFGGGTPTGDFGGSIIQTASEGALGLNNSGDTITLNNGASDLIYVYGSEGGNDESLTRDPDITGLDPLVGHSTATGSAGALFSPGTLIDGSSFAAGCSGPTEVKIHEIQGNGLASPLVGQEVIIEGIVVGDFQDGASGVNGDLNGFYVQEEDADADADPLTSEGIFVFDGSSPITNVMIGDLVNVVGQVSEFNDLTEITSFSGVTVINSGNPLPTAATLALPVNAVSDFEAYEGMLVTFQQELVISEYFNFDRFGEIVLTSDRRLTPTAEFEPGPDAIQAAQDYLLSRITLDDGRTNQNPDPAIHPNGSVFDLTNLFRGGDTVANVTGVMDFAFGLYRIQPTQGADYVNVNPRTTQPDDVGGTLKVASFNVLNYFSTLDDGVNDICGPLQNLECRGADTPEEFQRQRDKIFSALAAIDADVVGLIEIENHVTDAAVQDLVTGLNEAIGSETYAYIATGPIGGDAIKVAFIYKPASVNPVGNHAILDSSVDSRFLDDFNRPALAQTFYDRYTGGHFTVVVNHLKSKGSDCNDVGDPDLGDGAGNCNVTRTLAAQALVDWLATDPTSSGDPDFLIIGDLNAYDKEDPIDAILAGSDDVLGSGDDYTDLLYHFIGEDAYSYVFDGQVGYLDHGLANADLITQVTNATVWHINADEADLIDYDTSFKQDAQDAIYAPDAYRSSDHDPVIIGLQLEPEGLIVNENGCYVIGIEGTPYVYAYNLVTTDSRSLKEFRWGGRTYQFKAFLWAREQGLPWDTCYEIHGTNMKDMIFAGFGNDLIFGYDNHDALYGSHGDDVFSGGNGRDLFLGSSGYDTVLDYEKGDKCASIEEGCPWTKWDHKRH